MCSTTGHLTCECFVAETELWPAGHYGLPNPASGCPRNGNVLWSIGRKHTIMFCILSVSFIVCISFISSCNPLLSVSKIYYIDHGDTSYFWQTWLILFPPPPLQKVNVSLGELLHMLCLYSGIIFFKDWHQPLINANNIYINVFVVRIMKTSRQD